MAYNARGLICMATGKHAARRDPMVNHIWTLRTADAIATVNTDGYIADAKHCNMKVGDIVWAITSTGGTIAASTCMVTEINTDGSANLSNGVALTLTDSD